MTPEELKVKLQAFVAKWDNKGTDFDGYYGFQCMDLMHQFIYEVLGLSDATILAAPTAQHVFLNFDTVSGHQYFERVENTPTNFPPPGAIVFFKAPYGKYIDEAGKVQYAGHVAINIEADVKAMNLFTQNDPTYSLPHEMGYKYTNCLGWLVFKGVKEENQSLQKQLDDMRGQRDDNDRDRKALYAELGGTGDFNRTWAITEIQQLQAQAKDVGEKEKTIADLKKELEEEKAKLLTAQREIADIKGTAKETKETADATHHVAEVTEVKVNSSLDKVEEMQKQVNAAIKNEPEATLMDFFIELGKRLRLIRR